MTTGEGQAEGQLPQLTITGEGLLPEQVERLMVVAHELGYAAVFQSGAVEVGEQREEEASIPDLDVIVEANRLYQELYDHHSFRGTELRPAEPQWNGF